MSPITKQPVLEKLTEELTEALSVGEDSKTVALINERAGEFITAFNDDDDDLTFDLTDISNSTRYFVVLFKTVTDGTEDTTRLPLLKKFNKFIRALGVKDAQKGRLFCSINLMQKTLFVLTEMDHK
jgi:hypothetical protein